MDFKDVELWLALYDQKKHYKNGTTIVPLSASAD